MKIPKYIDKLLQARAYHADRVLDVGYKIDEWLIKNEIDVAPEDYGSGVEVYEAPYESADRVRDAIYRKENRK